MIFSEMCGQIYISLLKVPPILLWIIANEYFKILILVSSFSFFLFFFSLFLLELIWYVVEIKDDWKFEASAKNGKRNEKVKEKGKEEEEEGKK